MTTPRRGSSGPGLLMPMAATEVRRFDWESSAAEMALSTAARPAAASRSLTIGTRTLERISPRGVTIPAATFVPPMSTPRNSPSAFDTVDRLLDRAGKHSVNRQNVIYFRGLRLRTAGIGPAKSREKNSMGSMIGGVVLS